MEKKLLSSRIAVLIFGLFTVAYFAISFLVARHLALQHDEIFTMWIVRDTPSVLHALTIGADTAPIGFYYMMRGVCHILGYTGFALRLPAILAFYVFLLSIFFLLRRYVGVAIAACATTLPVFSVALDAAPLGRPYAMVMACFGLICLIWCHEPSKRPAQWRSWTIALLLAFAIAMHFYAVLLVPLFVVMELVWAIQNRFIRWSMVFAAIGGGGSLLLSLPVILPIFKATHESSRGAGYYAKPEINSLVKFVQETAFSTRLVSIYILALLVGAAFAAYRTYRREPGNEPAAPAVSRDYLGTVAFAAMLYPIATFVFALLVTRVFNERYFYGAVLGVSVGFALLVRRFHWTATPGVVLLALTTLVYAKDLRYHLKSHGDGNESVMALVNSTPPDAPVVIAGVEYFTFAEAKDPQVREKATFLLPVAGTHNPNPEIERIAEAWKALRPDLHIIGTEDFLAQHKTFYVLTETEDATEGTTPWLVKHLHAKIYRYEGTRLLLEITQ